MKQIALLALLFTTGQAMADIQPEVSLGLKIWNASWSSYAPASLVGSNGATGGEIDVFQASGEKAKLDVVPSLAIRFDRFIVSASRTDVDRDFSVLGIVNTPTQTTPMVVGRTDTFSRKEWDINFGYLVSPNFIASLGYKLGTETRDMALAVPGTSKQRIIENDVHGFLFGASFNTPLLDRLGGYAQFAYSPANVTTKVIGVDTIKANSHYYMTEVGLAYPLLSEPATFIKRATLSGGYRAQIVRTESKHMATLTSGSAQNLNDTREGLVMNLNLTF